MGVTYKFPWFLIVLDRVLIVIATASALQISNLAQPTTYSGDYGVAEGVE